MRFLRAGTKDRGSCASFGPHPQTATADVNVYPPN